jgi:hypothetical protein
VNNLDGTQYPREERKQIIANIMKKFKAMNSKIYWM